MARNYDEQSSIRQYLLNRLTGDEQELIEQRLLTEEGCFEDLEIAEDELIDEYIAEKLSPDERERFEQYFLATPERRQKVRFSRSLNRYLKKPKGLEKAKISSESHFWFTHNTYRVVAAVAAIAVVAAIFWLSRSPAPSTLATFTLKMSYATRGKGTPAVTQIVPFNADVRLLLELPEGSNSALHYRVALLKESGEPQTLPGVRQDGQSLIIDFVARQLSRGQYGLNVYAIKPDGTEQSLSGIYLFIVD
jgi:hypothetical protein